MKKVILSILFLGTTMLSCEDQANQESFKEVAEAEGLNFANVEGEVLVDVEQAPEYPGGMQEMFRFIGENLKYPSEAKEKEVEGKVFVKFVVTKDGKIGNVETLKGIGYGCEEEVARVLASMPDWQPAQQDGEPVNVYFTMPVQFKLQ